MDSFTLTRRPAVRVNTLKTNKATIIRLLNERAIPFQEVSWDPSALVLETAQGLDDVIKEGRLYIQGLSSMVPALVLDPRPGERVLDLCAAPGSKTTQMAALMENTGEITAVESVKDRFYKLRSVVALLGAENVRLKFSDGRKFRDRELFDRVLVDAPCSSEGRFTTQDKKSFAFWSPRKIKEMAHKQRGLLLNASRLLRPGGTLVYSTCTFAPEENEGAVDWLLKKTDENLSVEPVNLPGVAVYPTLIGWEKKTFNPQVRHCCRILPTPAAEGFFVAKFSRVHG